MDVAEHIYKDDPQQGPPDARTTLAGVEYFFLGNGLIQAGVQVCTSGEGTPVGLLVLHPDRLGPKRAALTFDPHHGLAPTVVTIRAGTHVFAPRPAAVDAQWTDVGGVPAVQVTWQDGDLRVVEVFYCHDRRSPCLRRIIRVRKSSPGNLRAVLCTGAEHAPLEQPIELTGDAPTEATLSYELQGKRKDRRVVVEWLAATPADADAARYWAGLGALTCSSPTLEHLFRAARNQLPAAVTATGMMDGGIWQYNLEWVRDQACAASALVCLGAFDSARTMLARLLTEFVSDEGGCVDSGRRREPADVELDQNGYLMTALETYVNWTGDAEMLRRHWPRIVALAEFPLRAQFRHGPSGLLHNRREYWERHDVHGIQDGMELTHQLYVAVGLDSAARLAGLVGQQEQAARWTQESQRIRGAMLGNARYSQVERGRFIKRRDVSGAVQETITPVAEAGLPPGVPLADAGPHYLDPDTSAVLPIVLEFVDPRGELARNTLADVERLWNQRWDHGGYGRYHVSSEPDSPGPWPFASLFVARAYFEAGEDDKVWRILNWLRSVPGGRAGAWFEFYGPRPVPPCPQIGVIPWTWAEIACFFIHHLLGVRPGCTELLLRPRLLAGLDRVEARLCLRGHALRIAVRRADRSEPAQIVVAGESHPYNLAGIRLPMPTANLEVQVVAPA
ncbi:MAG TPA: hypothetical protein PKK06_07140 [Phycisphaerae bacterium]|nr:hypothetical protein [Phycisphaerae bacterium]HNU45085.1 hypothetical protein [Phycisphaerae bacterium]